MSRGIRISTIILSAILISSCAADRFQVARNESIACKTEKTRYDFGKNKPVQALKSNKSKYSWYISHLASGNTRKSLSSKNVARKGKHPEMLFYGLNEVKNLQVQARQDGTELMFLKQMLKSSQINLSHNELKKFQDPVSENAELRDIFINPSKAEKLFPINIAKNESDYPYVLKQEELDNNLNEKSPLVAAAPKLNEGKSEPAPKTPFNKSEIFILMMAILGGLIPLAAIKANPKLASDISFWAAQNPWKTRFMSAGMQIAMATGGVLLGARFADNGLHFTALSRDLLVGAFLTSSMLYPVKYSPTKIFKHSYIRQKAFDLALVMSGFMLMAYAGNDPVMRASLTKLVSFKSTEQQNMNMLNDQNRTPKQLVYYQNDKQLQDEQTANQNKETGNGSKIAGTVLIVLLALGLGFLVAVGACAIYCNGLIGLSFVVGIGGGGLLIWGTIKAIRSIWNPRLKKRIKPSESSGSMTQTGTLQT